MPLMSASKVVVVEAGESPIDTVEPGTFKDWSYRILSQHVQGAISADQINVARQDSVYSLAA